MKKHLKIILIASLLCLAFASFAQDNEASGIIFRNYEHNFGTLDYGEKAECEFVFKNTSDSSLVITNVKAKCGCTSTDWTKSPVKSRKKGSITIVYNTKIIGRFTKSVYVYTNLNSQPIKLLVKGNVKAPETADK